MDSISAARTLPFLLPQMRQTPAVEQPVTEVDRGVPPERLANARIAEAWQGIAGDERVPRARVGDDTAAPVATHAAPGSDAVRDEMTAAGMTQVSDPPTESQVRTYFSQHAPHHEMIAERRYGDAAAAYRADAAALPEGDARRHALEQRARQLEYTDHMASAAKGRHQQVSFPPTWEQTRAHFHGLRSADAATVGGEFQDYARAFYNHVQREGDPGADVVYDHESGPVRGEQGRWGTDTPEDFADVTDQRRMNAGGQRLIDCEGYAWMGEQLLREAGFRQAGGDQGYKVARPHTDAAGPYDSHVMVNMTRGREDVWISNDRAYASDSPERNRRQALSSALTALSRANGGIREFEIYHGATDREATVHAETRSDRFSE